MPYNDPIEELKKNRLKSDQNENRLMWQVLVAHLK